MSSLDNFILLNTKCFRKFTSAHLLELNSNLKNYFMIHWRTQFDMGIYVKTQTVSFYFWQNTFEIQTHKSFRILVEIYKKKPYIDERNVTWWTLCIETWTIALFSKQIAFANQIKTSFEVWVEISSKLSFIDERRMPGKIAVGKCLRITTKGFRETLSTTNS